MIRSLFAPAILSAMLFTGCSQAAEAPAAPAPAATAQPAMPRLSAFDTISACLYRHRNDGRMESCIFEYATACNELSEEGATPEGVVRCHNEEADAWERHLAEARETMAASMSSGGQAALAAAQDAWLVSRDADCAMLASFYAGTQSALAEQAICRARLTGRRAIQLILWDLNYPPY